MTAVNRHTHTQSSEKDRKHETPATAASKLGNVAARARRAVNPAGRARNLVRLPLRERERERKKEREGGTPPRRFNGGGIHSLIHSTWPRERGRFHEDGITMVV